jgi:multiple sugar transport system ATP-binding protein
MNAGRIEQVGPPQELYHNPATRFVAGFIGSPAMNFLTARVFDESGLKVKLANGEVLPIPPQRFNRYAAYKDRDMILGLRPEHITEPKDVERPGAAPLTAPVDVVEPMGMETLVHFFIGGEPMTARIDPAVYAAPGENLRLSADMNQMHLIEADTGKVV